VPGTILEIIMWFIVRRAVAPTLLVAIGVAAIVMGVGFHPIVVLTEQTVEKTTTEVIDVPLPPPEAGPDGSGDLAADQIPFGMPTSIKKTVTRIQTVKEEKPLTISEPDFTRDVTVGGVVRLASGALRRTYGSESKGPAECPT
jgi:hypothetical protein